MLRFSLTFLWLMWDWWNPKQNYPASNDKFGTITFSKPLENLYPKAYKYEEKSGAKNPKEIMKMS